LCQYSNFEKDDTRRSAHIMKASSVLGSFEGTEFTGQGWNKWAAHSSDCTW